RMTKSERSPKHSNSAFDIRHSLVIRRLTDKQKTPARRAGAAAEFLLLLLLQVLDERTVFGDPNGRVFTLVLELDLIDHAAIGFMPRDIDDLGGRRVRLDGLLHLLRQG